MVSTLQENWLEIDVPQYSNGPNWSFLGAIAVVAAARGDDADGDGEGIEGSNAPRKEKGKIRNTKRIFLTASCCGCCDCCCGGGDGGDGGDGDDSGFRGLPRGRRGRRRRELG